MKIRPRISVGVVLWLAVANICCLLTAAPTSAAQNSTGTAKTDSKQAAPQPSPANSRIKITVTGGDNETAVENASVYVKYVEEHKISKDKKLELNVKTSREGVAHVPNAPSGRVLIQVIAEGWKTYGRWYDITDPNQEFKIHLERPPKWY
jgi:hypothetical protein